MSPALWRTPRSQGAVARVPVLVAIASAVLVVALSASIAAAQTGTAKTAQASGVLSIEVANVILCEPGAETRFAIGIAPLAALPLNSFMRVKGLPASAQLTDGHQIAAGAWAIPIDGLAKLHVKVAQGAQGKSDLSLTLFSIEGLILAEARAALVIGPAGLIAPAAEASVVPSPKLVTRGQPPVPPPRAMSQDDKTQAQRLFERGTAQLRAGSMAGARALLERAADLGLADAAMALAGTYDAWELSRLSVLGVQPDPVAARKWYARAQELGAPAAAERLARLPK